MAFSWELVQSVWTFGAASGASSPEASRNVYELPRFLLRLEVRTFKRFIRRKAPLPSSLGSAGFQDCSYTADWPFISDSAEQQRRFNEHSERLAWLRTSLDRQRDDIPMLELDRFV